jgi:transposase InsO family protein
MPVCSLALKAKRDGAVSANTTTWYRYARNLGWRRPFSKRSKRTTHGLGIRARKVHQVWHVDVTEIKALNEEKLFLAAVLDNFSRAVLSWRLVPYKSQEISKAILEEAMKKFGKYKASVLELISDGGSENSVFKKMTDGVIVQHKIAGKEINHPNTMIEAFFRSLKSDYLSRIELKDAEGIRVAVSFFIEHHNKEIPRISLEGRTPVEVLTGDVLRKPLVHRQNFERVEKNRNIACPHCWSTRKGDF